MSSRFSASIARTVQLSLQLNEPIPMSASLRPAKQRLQLDTIPTDAIFHILARCDVASILALRSVSKFFGRLIDSAERPLVGGMIRDRYAVQADLFERMGRNAWRRRYMYENEIEFPERPTFSKLSFEYLWIVETRNNYLFQPLVESIRKLGMRRSEAYDMAVACVELSIISRWPRSDRSFAALASWSASKIMRMEASLRELAENAKCIDSWEMVNPHEDMPQDDYLPESVTEDELDFYGLPAIYNMHCIMGRDWPLDNVFHLGDILLGEWDSYDHDMQCRWFKDMEVWVDYDGEDDEWGTLYVRFADARYDPLKLFAALKNVPKGKTISPTWWEDVWDEPSASFDRSTFWSKPSTIWNWKGGSYGLRKLFYDPQYLRLDTALWGKGYVPWDITDLDDADLWRFVLEEPEGLDEQEEWGLDDLGQWIENPGEDRDAENGVALPPGPGFNWWQTGGGSWVTYRAEWVATPVVVREGALEEE